MVIRGWEGPQWEKLFLHVFILEKIFQNLLQNKQANFSQTDINYLCIKGIQIFSNIGPGPLQRGDSHKDAKNRVQ
jgi:hypothetical protein